MLLLDRNLVRQKTTAARFWMSGERHSTFARPAIAGLTGRRVCSQPATEIPVQNTKLTKAS